MSATLRRLPRWLADGPQVSELAYRIVVVAFDDPPRRPTSYGDREGVSALNVVQHLTEQLEVDEADVLRALAELQRAGVIASSSRGGELIA